MCSSCPVLVSFVPAVLATSFFSADDAVELCLLPDSKCAHQHPARTHLRQGSEVRHALTAPGLGEVHRQCPEDV